MQIEPIVNQSRHIDLASTSYIHTLFGIELKLGLPLYPKGPIVVSESCIGRHIVLLHICLNFLVAIFVQFCEKNRKRNYCTSIEENIVSLFYIEILIRKS